MNIEVSVWMTLDEIAEYLKVSRETIYKMAQKGHIPGSKLGNQWRFNRPLIDEWLKSHSNSYSVSPSQEFGEAK